MSRQSTLPQYQIDRPPTPDPRPPTTVHPSAPRRNVQRPDPVGLAARTRLFGWLERGLLLSSHALPERHSEVWTELTRYHGRSVDFADACLTVLGDLHPSLTLVTTDRRDFSVYLRGRSPRLLLTPSSWQP